MDAKTEKAVAHVTFAFSRMKLLTQKAKEADPDIFVRAKGEITRYSKKHSCEMQVKFEGGTNADCHKLVGLIVATLSHLMPGIDIPVSASYAEPYGEPSFVLTEEAIKKMGPKLDQINTAFLALSNSPPEELKKNIEQFDLKELLADTSKAISYDIANTLLLDMKAFTAKAGIECGVRFKYRLPQSMVFAFDAGEGNDALRLAGTIASKLTSLGSVRLEFEDIPFPDTPSRHCNIVLNQGELENIQSRQLLEARRALKTTKSPESLRHEINNFSIVKDYYLVDGTPKPWAKSH